MNSSDYLINCQLVSFISQCFELRTKLISMNEWMRTVTFCNVLHVLISWKVLKFRVIALQYCNSFMVMQIKHFLLLICALQYKSFKIVFGTFTKLYGRLYPFGAGLFHEQIKEWCYTCPLKHRYLFPRTTEYDLWTFVRKFVRIRFTLDVYLLIVLKCRYCLGQEL